MDYDAAEVAAQAELEEAVSNRGLVRHLTSLIEEHMRLNNFGDAFINAIEATTRR